MVERRFSSALQIACQGKVRHFCRGVVDVSMAVGARLQGTGQRDRQRSRPAFWRSRAISMPVALDRDISIMVPRALSRLVRRLRIVGVSPGFPPRGYGCLLIWACALLQEPCQTSTSVDALASRPPDRDARCVGLAALLRCIAPRVGLGAAVLFCSPYGSPFPTRSGVLPNMGSSSLSARGGAGRRISRRAACADPAGWGWPPGSARLVGRKSVFRR